MVLAEYAFYELLVESLWYKFPELLVIATNIAGGQTRAVPVWLGLEADVPIRCGQRTVSQTQSTRLNGNRASACGQFLIHSTTTFSISLAEGVG